MLFSRFVADQNKGRRSRCPKKEYPEAHKKPTALAVSVQTIFNKSNCGLDHISTLAEMIEKGEL